MANPLSQVASQSLRALPWLGRLVTIAVLALLAWLGARIFWAITAPATTEPALAVDTDPTRVAQAIGARHLFGEAPRQALKVAATGGAAGAKLFGIVMPARKGDPGIALVSVQGKPAAAFREGDEIASGVVLQRVLVRSVEISQGGVTQVLTLPERGKS